MPLSLPAGRQDNGFLKSAWRFCLHERPSLPSIIPIRVTALASRGCTEAQLGTRRTSRSEFFGFCMEKQKYACISARHLDFKAKFCMDWGIDNIPGKRV